MTMQLSPFQASLAVKFLKALVGAAEHDSSGQPFEYLKRQLAKYDKWADIHLEMEIWEELDKWVQEPD